MSNYGCFLIAEIGSTHDGKRKQMSEAIQIAQGAGANAIKFQWTSTPNKLAMRRQAEEYLWAYEKIAFPIEWLAELKHEADRTGIAWLCTVYLPEDIAVIASLVQQFKISSFEAMDEKFVKLHEIYNKPIILSVPGHDEPFYVGRALLLHCVSAYPAPTDEMNLSVLRGHDGLSDHSAHPWMGALAVAAGARIIEVHFRLDSTDLANPDYGHSLSPAQLRQYVQNVRFAEAAMGDGVKRLMPSEERWAKYRVRA